MVEFDYKGGTQWRVLAPSLDHLLESLARLLERGAVKDDGTLAARFPEMRVIELVPGETDPGRFERTGVRG